MIAKILNLRGIGMLHDALLSAGGSAKAVVCGKLTVIYAENGRGKSTLAAILRSFSTGETSDIASRTTVGGTLDPHVGFLIGNKPHQYIGGTWSATFASLVVFDTHFIDANVYSGMSVNADQRRNLLTFALGEDGVRLAKEVDQLNEAIKELNTKIALAQGEVGRFTANQFPVDEFLDLDTGPDPEVELRTCQQEVKSIRDIDLIRQGPMLQQLTFQPITQQDTEQILAQTLDNISGEAEAKVRAHLERLGDPQAEGWIAKGTTFAGSFDCPFCGQDITTSELVSLYAGYFSQAYKGLKDRVSQHKADVAGRLHEAGITTAAQIVGENGTHLAFWQQHTSVSVVPLAMNELIDATRALRKELDQALNAKLTDPLQAAQPSPALRQAFAGYAEVLSKVDGYNASVAQANAAISAFKASLETTSLASAENRLTLALNRRARSRPDAEEACNKLADLYEEKLGKDAEKDRAKDDLNEYTKTVLEVYQEDINTYLKRCGAGFSIEEIKPSYGGGLPRTDYKVRIKDSAIGIAEGKGGGLSFRTALSDGDKRTLAFAFFVARLLRDPKIAEKVVIFDDPVVSFDAHRRNLCVQQIGEIHNVCAQTIVLTHDPQFARLLASEINDDACTTYMLRRNGEHSALVPCDLAVVCQDSYTRSYSRAMDYLVVGPRGEIIDIARCVRPLIEGCLRSRFPTRFQENASLGDMLAQIRGAGQGDVLVDAANSLEVLTDLNEFAVRYHHDGSGLPADYDLTDGELRPVVERAITYVHGGS